MFIGRKKEKENIISHLNKDGFEYLLVYGIRRVGKTKLINECLKETNGKVISYMFRDIPKEANLNEFISYIPSCFNESYITLKDLNGCLKYLCEKAKNEKIVLYIDEYPFLRRDDSGIDSCFQEIKNLYDDISNLKIIFCGSYASVMLKMIDANAPLYGRFSYILNLMPFDYYDSSLFMGNISNEEKIKYYSCFGGLGFTLRNIDFKKTFEENLKNLFIETDSLFEREVSSIVSLEIGKIPDAKYLLELIASGKHKYTDLNSAFMNVNKGNNISYLLNKLRELDLIEKVVSINENKTKNDMYFIKDNLLDFYYTFLSRTYTERSVMSTDSFLDRIREKVYKEYIPRKFEKIALQFFVKLNKEKMIKPFSSIGRLIYNDKKRKTNGELDLVLKNDDGYVDIECKYYERKLTHKDYMDEINQLSNIGLRDMSIGFASKKGFDDSFPKDVIQYELDDFYKF